MNITVTDAGGRDADFDFALGWWLHSEFFDNQGLSISYNIAALQVAFFKVISPEQIIHNL